jgi:hypothetical protein
MRIFRMTALTAMLAGLVWFAFFNSASAREVGREALDTFDSRPVRSVLFVGNSRTYPHDMPYMVRAMADSAGSEERYRIRMLAFPGESLKGHWHNKAVRQAIAEGWDAVVLQEMSGGHAGRERSADFQDYGARLIADAAGHGARPLLFVGWNYGREVFRGMPAAAEGAYYRAIQDDHLRLARRTRAELANVGKVWRYLRAVNAPFRLDSDGNHPTLHGSYLAALVIYARLTGRGVAYVTYVPEGMSAEDAALLRRLAGEGLRRPD